MTNLITNGNFAAGNTGFTVGSKYTYLTGAGSNDTNPDDYSIVTNPQASFADGYYSYTAPTGNGSNNMLLVDGSTTAGQSFWGQTVQLTASTTYTFTYEVASADSASPATIQFYVGGVATGALETASGAQGWQAVTVTFKTAANGGGAVAISMVDTNTTQNGNDFTIDSLSLTAACYARGTRIATERGDIAIEALEVGDVAITASGRRPIVWIGHRHIDLARHRDPAAVMPVCVRADAFGPGLPQRDLWLSPGHNIAFDGALMPISALVNGRSVATVECAAIEYWHVELDAHDVILAEGLPSESYLDTGNRAAFANGAAFVEAHPDFAPKFWTQTCLPLADGGETVVAAKAHLLARLAEAGRGVDHSGDIHIEADGVKFAPICLNARKLLFILPAGAREIALRSRVFVPAQTLCESTDPRELGVCVAALVIDGCWLDLEAEETCAAGWRQAEYDGAHFSHRWTSGAARLPAGARNVIVHLAGHGVYWSAAAPAGYSLPETRRTA